ncbi:MAG: TonB-dependent receptor [Rhodospirillaceae bacterium]|nr:TonB-dependent receptor [Rhodospirillaceae bacterium]
MTTMRLKSALLCAAASVSLLVGGSAFAQQQQAQAQGGLEEIVVTAQRRAENLQEVPVTVTAFSPGELERRNIDTTIDLVKFVPNMLGHSNTGPATSNTYFMRGLGSTDTLSTIDLPVATYFDEIVISRQNANQLSFFDVDQIEVLHGPQGTLFGRNVTGGAISVTMKKPAEEFSGNAQVGYGRYNYYEARATVNAPISEKLLTQLGAFYTDDDGYVKNYATGDKLNDTNNLGLRGAFTGKLSDTITWNGSFNYMRARGTNLLNDTCDTLNPGVPANCEGRWIFSGLAKNRQPAFPNLVVSIGGVLTPATLTGAKNNFDPQTTKANTKLSMSNFTIEASDNMTINVITGHVHTKQDIAIDFQSGRNGRSPANPGPAVPFTLGPAGSTTGHPLGSGFTLSQRVVSDQFTQEIKATGSLMGDQLKYVAGVYYYDENSDMDLADIFPVAGTNQGLIGRDQQVANGTKAWAGYAQFDYALTQQLTATVGARFTNEKKDFDTKDSRPAGVVSTVTVNGQVRNNRLDTANLAQFGIPTDQEVNLWTPRFALNYQATDDALLFASATNGFRSGGWNARGSGANTLLTFKPEKVWSYELGAKTEWWDNRFRFNATLFHMDVKQFQSPASFVAAGATAPTFLTLNDADMRNQGIEIESQIMPVDGLNIFGSLGYQDGKYRNQGATTVAQLAACKAAIAANASAAVRFGPVSGGLGGCGQGIVNVNGEYAELARTPPWTGSIGANYEIPMDSWNVNIVPSVSANYSSTFESAAANVSFFRAANGTNSVQRSDGPFVSGSLTESYWVVNASLAIVDQNDRYKVSVECQNCFGEVYNVAGISGYSYLSHPGNWMLKVRTNF